MTSPAAAAHTPAGSPGKTPQKKKRLDAFAAA